MTHVRHQKKFQQTPLYNFLLDLLFPIHCCVCDKPGSWLCNECQDKLTYNNSNYCLHCYKESDLGVFCDQAKQRFSLSGIIIAGSYKNIVLKNLIKTYKYKSIKSITPLLSDFLINYLTDKPELNEFISNLPKNETIVIPVPLHKKRQAWRGFNQSLLLAENVSKQFNFQLDYKNLIRRKNKRPQAKLRGKKRLHNLQNNFKWQGPSLARKTIIILDDITTTGTTMNECAKVLKEAGAEKLWGLALAKG